MLPKEDREIISKIGRYNYNKMKELNMSLDEFQKYKNKIKAERELKEKIGYRTYNKMKQLGFNYEEYKQYQREKKLKQYEKKREKDKIRFKTIRYIERYCNLEMKCQECGTKEDVQIHHPNYSDYLKVNILCLKHHKQLHNFELIPPKIIDLEKISVKKPIQKEREKYIQSQMGKIKTDIFTNNLSYGELKQKFGIDPQTMKRHLKKENDYEKIYSKLKENGKMRQSIRNNSNPKNPLLPYKQKYKLNSQEISQITEIPLPTIRAIESGKTDILKIRPKTKKKLEKLNEVV